MGKKKLIPSSISYSIKKFNEKKQKNSRSNLKYFENIYELTD